LEKGQRGRKKDFIAKGEFSVLDVISFSNIFRGFHHEIQEEVSFDSARFFLDFSLRNLGLRENRSTKLFRAERSRTPMRSLTSGQKITSESHKELRVRMSLTDYLENNSRPNLTFPLVRTEG
jgi:hypothetical protein